LKLPLQLKNVEPLNLEKFILRKVENFKNPHIGDYGSFEILKEHARKLKEDHQKMDQRRRL